MDRNSGKAGIHVLLTILLLSSSIHALDFDNREALIWQTIDWQIENVAYSGNPFDVVATVTYTHQGTHLTRTTEMYYDGNNVWKFRFTGTLAGRWSLTTKSNVPELNNHKAVVTVSRNQNPRFKGFLTHKGNKFAIQITDENDLQGYIFNAYMSRVKYPAYLEEFGSDLTKVKKAASSYLHDARDNGFEVLFVHVNNNWFKFGSREHNKHKSENPDPAAFRVLETIITTVNAMGGRVHIWAWGDESRKWTPIGLPGGINGPADRRLQRYIAARLGPLPGWTMGYGFDLHEWTNSNQLNEWAMFMHDHLGWQHLLCARGYYLKGPGNMNSYDGFGRDVELATTPHGPADYQEIVEDLDSDTSRPHFYEERHSYKREGFTLDMDGTRRLLWAESMAGGMGGFFGFYPTSPHPYPNPQQLLTHYHFWHLNRRFVLDMERANHLIENGYALYSPSTSSAVYYKENTSKIRIKLFKRNAHLDAVAVDTRKSFYDETYLGKLAAKSYELTLPYVSDWAIAVGNFSTDKERSEAKEGSDPFGDAMTGRIIVDPDHPQWLIRKGIGPFFMCGPGDPEGFLYRGVLKPDGARAGDQSQLINKLRGTGANCIYLMAIRSHGGDGDKTQNPFIDHNPTKEINAKVLDQWERWFTEMDKAGIVIYFFFYDDSANPWKTGDQVGQPERNFLQTIVNRFEHHNSLIWCIAEEYGEVLSHKRVSNIAAIIRQTDDHKHVIAVHKNNGLDFPEFADDKNIDQFAIQYNVDTAEQLHTGMLDAWKKATGRYSLNMSEAAGFGTGAELRQKCWACAMGGAYVMILNMDIANTPIEDLKACGYLVRFFESTDFNRMSPHDKLAHAGAQYVLADPGQSYIAYASNLKGEIGLKALEQGQYQLTWLDCATGKTITQNNLTLATGDQTWPKPNEIGNELALYIRKR